MFLNAIRLKKCVIKQHLISVFVFDCIPDQCKTQEMFDVAVDYSLAVLKLIPDWFVIKKLFTTLYADKNIYYFNEGPSGPVFHCKGMSILNI